MTRMPTESTAAGACDWFDRASVRRPITRAQLDQATDSLHQSQKATEQAKFAYEQAVHGYTAEERQTFHMRDDSA